MGTDNKQNDTNNNSEKKVKQSRQSKQSRIIEKNINRVVIVFLLLMVVLSIYSIKQYEQLHQTFVNLNQSYNNLQEENRIFKETVDEQNIKLDDLNEKIDKFLIDKISKEQFTEVYVQIKELTGMMSEEKKREYYLDRIVNIVSNNGELDSETVYEIAKNIYEISLKYKFNPFLICALIKVESDFRTDSISDSYAYGLCQVSRLIAKELAKNLGIEWDGAEKTLLSPEKNIQIGIHYLSMLYNDFGEMKLALTAYNYGPFKVQEFISQNNGVPNGYADRILDYYARYRGFKIDEIDEILNGDSEEYSCL